VLLHQQPLLTHFAHQLRRWPPASCSYVRRRTHAAASVQQGVPSACRHRSTGTLVHPDTTLRADDPDRRSHPGAGAEGRARPRAARVEAPRDSGARVHDSSRGRVGAAAPAGHLSAPAPPHVRRSGRGAAARGPWVVPCGSHARWRPQTERARGANACTTAALSWCLHPPGPLPARDARPNGGNADAERKEKTRAALFLCVL